jgi:hypothetical protein
MNLYVGWHLLWVRQDAWRTEKRVAVPVKKNLGELLGAD